MQADSGFAGAFRRMLIRGAAPFGAFRAAQYLNGGLPAGFRTALEYLFQGRLEADDVAVVERVERMRNAFATRTETFHVYAAADAREPRAAARLARNSSVTPFWGTFLYLCAKGFRADSILELGSCIGISGSYLASAPACRQFVSIERSEDTAEIARTHIQHILPAAQIINAPINAVLAEVVRSFENGISLIYVDAFHRYEPTLEYFETARPFLRRGALVIFDDIHWSKEMWEAWLHLRRHPGFSHTVDVGRFGLCLWQGGNSPPQLVELAKYAGWLYKYDPRR